MKPSLIPAINVKTEAEFREQLAALEDHTGLVQIDITDGTLTPGVENWHDPDVIRTIDTSLSYELHLMVEDPRIELAKWQRVENIERVIIHAESIYRPVERGERNDLFDALPTFFAYGYDIIVAINPDTKVDVLEPLMGHLYNVMILGVTPGKSGQKFKKAVLKKISHLRTHYPTLNIAVDGGVNLTTMPAIVEAGANILCMSSAIFNKKDTAANNLNTIKMAMNELSTA